ncbi:MAG: OB-fold domain-containing protein [Deltaproteobacteria bacterium]
MSENENQGALRAEHVLEYPFRRSLGPVLERFFTALQEQRLLGAKTPSGKVIVPPAEYDPDTAAAIGPEDLVEVGPGGEVTTWCWVAQPREKQCFAHPFAYALVKLDGADAPMLHAVDAGEEAKMKTGMRVQPRWAAEPQGGIRDLECFVPEEN